MSHTPKYALVAFSESPIVDLIYEAVPADIDWLQPYNEWQITSQAEQKQIRDHLSQLQIPSEQFSGGQIGNTLYNLAHLFKGQIPLALYAYLGKDQTGFQYANEFLAQNISLEHLQFGNAATNISLSLQLTNQTKKMFTCLNDLHTFAHSTEAELRSICSQTSFILLEGYLWNRAQESSRKLLKIAQSVKAKENPNLKVALTLSTPPVAAKMDLALLQETVDLIAGNDDEYKGLLKIPIETTNIDLSKHFSLEKTLIYTNGSKGATIQHQGATFTITPDPLPCEKIVDVTGAGDGFLAAVLFGLFNQMSLPEMAKFATAISARIIQQKGARL